MEQCVHEPLLCPQYNSGHKYVCHKPHHWEEMEIQLLKDQSYVMSDTDCCVLLTGNVEIGGIDILSWGDWLCLLVAEGPVFV